MQEELLAETMGEDTTTQLYRDTEGAFRVRIMALPEEGGERVTPAQSPHVFHDCPLDIEEAHALYSSPAATRHVAAFPEAE